MLAYRQKSKKATGNDRASSGLRERIRYNFRFGHLGFVADIVLNLNLDNVYWLDESILSDSWNISGGFEVTKEKKHIKYT